LKKLPPPLTKARAEAFSSSALRFVCWLFGLIVRTGFSGRSRKLRDVIRTAERAVELTLFLHAVARFGPLPHRRPSRPASAPPGIRVKATRSQLFYKRANIRARKAHVIDRVLALLDALQNPEHAITYFPKRIRKGLRGRSLVIAAPVPWALAFTLALPSSATLDSS